MNFKSAIEFDMIPNFLRSRGPVTKGAAIGFLAGLVFFAAAMGLVFFLAQFDPRGPFGSLNFFGVIGLIALTYPSGLIAHTLGLHLQFAESYFLDALFIIAAVIVDALIPAAFGALIGLLNRVASKWASSFTQDRTHSILLFWLVILLTPAACSPHETPLHQSITARAG